MKDSINTALDDFVRLPKMIKRLNATYIAFSGLAEVQYYRKLDIYQDQTALLLSAYNKNEQVL